MSGVENVHIPANRWRTLKSVVVWAEGEGGLLEARAVRGVMVREGGGILFVGKFNIVSSVS